MVKFFFTALTSLLFWPVLAQPPATIKTTASRLTEAKPEAVGMSSDRLQRIDRVVQEYVAKGRQAGVGVLIARNGKVVYNKTFGQDNLTAKTPLKSDAIYRIASQTKAITSIGVMMLFEEGRFLLDDPISKYLPAYKKMTVLEKFNEKDTTFTIVPATRDITIRQLLTHTSGISYPGIGTKEATAIYAKYKIPSGIGTPNYKLDDVMNRLAALPLMSQPGTRWSYSISTDLLGYFIEVVSGQPLDQFFKTRIFDPIGMNDTYFYLPAAKQSRLASLNTEDSTGKVRPVPANQGSFANYPNTKGTYFAGAAGLVSTLGDYAAFLQMLLNGGEYNGNRLLSPATVRMITTNQIGDLNVAADKFGLGFEITTPAGAARLPLSPGSFSWGGFFGTTYWADPKEGIVALLYTQKYPNTSAGDLPDKFRVLVYQALLK